MFYGLKFLVIFAAFFLFFAACDDGLTPPPTSSTSSEDEATTEEAVIPEWLRGSWYKVGVGDDFMHLYEINVSPSGITFVGFNGSETVSCPITSTNVISGYIAIYYFNWYSDIDNLYVIKGSASDEFEVFLSLYSSSQTSLFNRRLYRPAATTTFPRNLWGIWEYKQSGNGFPAIWDKRFVITEPSFIDFPWRDETTFSIIAEDFNESASGYQTLFLGQAGYILYSITLHYGEVTQLHRLSGGKSELIDIRMSSLEASAY
jgi:hypothetical protein